VLSPGARRGLRGGMRLFVPAIVFVLLQPRDCVFFFDLLPGFAKVQFPWRLLAYIVPAAVLALAVAVEWTLRASAPLWTAAAAVLAVLVVAGQLVTSVRAQRDGGAGGAKWKWPKVEDTAKALTDIETTATWDGFLPGGGPRLGKTAFVAASEGCTFSSPELTAGLPVKEHTPTEYFRRLRLTVHGKGCTLTLSQYDSPLVALSGTGPFELRTAPDRTMVIVAPDDGTTVTLRVRGILELAALAAKQRLTFVPPPQ